MRNYTKNPLKVVVVGASGIGRIHIREFGHAGANVIGIVGSTSQRAVENVEQFNKELQLNV